MRALVLAAGLGTRLAPLTRELPKALVPVVGRPAIGQVLRRLRRAGVREVGVNLHHHAEMLAAWLGGELPGAVAAAMPAGMPAGAAPGGGRSATLGTAVEDGVEGLKLRLVYEPEILGPAGGMAGFVDWWRAGTAEGDPASDRPPRAEGPTATHPASDRTREPLLLHNADAATNIDLRALLRAHRRREAELGPGRLALTLALVPHPPTDSVAVDARGRVVSLAARTPAGRSAGRNSFRSTSRPSAGRTPGRAPDRAPGPSSSTTARLWTYSGVAILGAPWMERLHPGRPAAFLPTVDAILAAGLEVQGWIAAGAVWHDLGTPARYLAAHQAILRDGRLPTWDDALPHRRPHPADHPAPPPADAARDPWRIAPDARLAPGVRLSGWGVLDHNTRIGRGARLHNVILWPNATVAPGEHLQNAIIAPWARVVLGPGRDPQ